MMSPLENLLPKPQSIEPREGCFAWTDATPLYIEPGNEQDRFAAESFMQGCLQRGLPVPMLVEIDEIPPDQSGPYLVAGDPCRNLALGRIFRSENIAFPAEIGDEGYMLEIASDRLLVAANSPAGVYYAFQTLIQMLSTDGDPAVAACRVVDWPSIRQRGVSIDSGRGETPTLDFLKQEVLRLAHFKMNLLVLYFEDGFLFPSHPDIGENRDRYTTGEMLELDAFARLHHVEIAPAFDSPGHLERMLAHPNYSHLAEMPDERGPGAVINPAHPETFPLMRDLYTDLCKAFPATTFYMGGDEAVQFGKGASKPLADAVGAGALFARHIKFVRDILAEHGKRMVMWGDPFEPGFFAMFGLDNYGLELLRQVPRDVIIAPWHYGEMPEFPPGDKIRGMGFDLHLWSSFGDVEMFPCTVGAARNIETYIPHARRLGALGVVHSSWNDTNSFNEFNWPNTACFAEWAWCSEPRPCKAILPIAAERFHGPNTGAIATGIWLLGHITKHFGWAGVGLSMAGFNLFYADMTPRVLDAEQLDHLKAFRKEWYEARALFEAARDNAIFHKEQLDYLDFAFEQQRTMADLTECRHLLGLGDIDAKQRAAAMLDRLSDTFPALCSRYKELWLRNDRPLGLIPNTNRYEKVLAAIIEARETLKQTSGI